MLINVKMSTFVGILTFMSRINFVLSFEQPGVCVFSSLTEEGKERACVRVCICHSLACYS